MVVASKRICLKDSSLRLRVESHAGRVNIKECLEAIAMTRDTKTNAVLDHLLYLLRAEYIGQPCKGTEKSECSSYLDSSKESRHYPFNIAEPYWPVIVT